MIATGIDRIYSIFLSWRSKQYMERMVFVAAIFFFLMHCLIILIINSGWSHQQNPDYFRAIPDLLSAIYTPFSIILLYEIYSLIYHLTQSITIYIAKQYEIIALIFIRGLFDNLAKASSHIDRFDRTDLIGLLISFGGLILLLLLIFCFYKLSGTKNMRTSLHPPKLTAKQSRYITIKKMISLFLIASFAVLFFHSFGELRHMETITFTELVNMFKKMSYQFFNHFFTILILTEVLLLLFTFNLTEHFDKVIRNSGFILSTILLKLSFRTEGWISISLILLAVLFGVVIEAIYKLYEQKLEQVDCRNCQSEVPPDTTLG
ncbi:MAG: hypothetical protein LUF85_05870 [Bacteroides sp.]|nr:hypothetical protein [Bacteroides sp.]